MSYDSLQTLEGLEAVRKRPGMYVGSTTSQDGANPRGLLQLAQEILSNSADEAIMGYGKEIILTVHSDNSMTIQDFGRGIPMGKDYDDVIRAFTVLHTSGKFDSKSYSNAGGQNGIGAKATNALSEYLTVEAVTSTGDAYCLTFEQNEVVSKSSRKRKKGEVSGTTVHFLPDAEIFETIEWDAFELVKKLDTLAYLNAGVAFNYVDERELPEKTMELLEHYYKDRLTVEEGRTQVVSEHEGGVKDLVADQVEGESLIGFKEPLLVTGESDGMTVEVALVYTETIGDQLFSYANGIRTPDGGPHEDGVRQTISKVLNQFVKDKKLGSRLDARDTRDGLVAAISVGIPEDLLQFESQTKEKLGTTEIKPVLEKILEEGLASYLYDHEKQGKAIVAKAKDSQSARKAAQEARKVSQANRESKRGGKKLLVSSKLTTAGSKNPKERELFIVEGDSAGGSAKRARDAKTQAILPLRGKPLNVLGLRLSRIIANEEISTLLNVIGAG